MLFWSFAFSSLCFLLFFIEIFAFPINENQNSTSKKWKKKFRVGFNASVELPKIEVPKKMNLTQIEKELKDFGIHSLKEEKHLEAVPLDRQGRANPHFHREIFLGNHELFENDIQNDEEKRNRKLKQIFIE